MIHGSCVAIVTPFKKGKLDEKAFENLIEFQINNGTHAIVPCGTTGESPTLSHSEHEQVIKLAIDISNKRIPIIAGTGSNCTDEAISLTKFAQSAGADACLLVVPYYNKPTQVGLYSHFKTISDSADIPLILYNIPGRTGINLLPTTVANLNEDCSNIIGIKEASGSVTQATEVLSLCGNDFILLSGEDSLNFPLLTIGGKGFITVTANIAPRDVSNLYEFFISGKYEEAKSLHYKLLPLNDSLFLETNPIPIKKALNLMGMIEDEIRSPLCSMSDSNEVKLKNSLKYYGLID